MREFTFHEAIDRHPEISDRPVSSIALQEHFESSPPESIRALLTKMGPFLGDTDGFRFRNSFPITAENAAAYLKLFGEEVIEQAVRLAAKPYTDVMSSFSIPIPLAPDLDLPDSLISSVSGKILGRIRSLIAPIVSTPIGSGYGRCGGMAFAGYDFYLQNWPVDQFGTTIPSETSPLGRYVFDRLVDSLDLNAVTFLEWLLILNVLPIIDEFATATLLAAAGALALPLGPALAAFIGSQIDIFDLGGAATLLDRTKSEWTIIKAKLDEEAAWPIGLIYGGKRSPFDQHQVLAIGYEVTAPERGTLTVWDNKFGAAEQSMELDFGGDQLVEHGLSGGVVKGFFHESYVPKRPPQSLRA